MIRVLKFLLPASKGIDFFNTRRVGNDVVIKTFNTRGADNDKGIEIFIPHK